MQHPDEGTIHAWVDGALTAEEAAQIDAHVKDCAECAAAVAEARGFIAASSRILTALDNAPRGVIPAAAPAKRRLDPMVWRIAASVLVLAGGTLVVVRNHGTRGTQETASTLTMDTSGSVAAFNARVESTHAEAAKPNPSIGNRVDLPTLTVPSMPKPAPMAQKSAAPSGGAPARRVAQAPAPASVSGFLPRTAVVASEGVAADTAVGSGEPLKVIGSPQRIGANVTLYEIGGDTVTLAESRPVALSGVVGSDAAAARMQVELRGKTAATRNNVVGQAAGAAQPVAAQPVAAQPVAPPPPVAAAPVEDAARPEDSNVVHTISWVDPVTRNTLTLSGRMSEARLQLIRLRIEKERAAAKKTP